LPNTSRVKLPYPSLTDAPNVPQHIQALAAVLENILPRNVQAAFASVTPVANTLVTHAVTFPTAFAATPVVTVTPHSSTDGAVLQCTITNTSPTGFTIVFKRTNTTVTTVGWIAVLI